MTTTYPPPTRRSGRRTADLRQLADPERVAWADLAPELVSAWGWPRGEYMPEHMEVLGQSGTGKSYFVKHLLLARAAARGSHIVVIATKSADKTITGMGWPIIQKWPPGYGQDQVIFWPKVKGIDRAAAAVQREKIKNLLSQLWVKDSNRVVVFDEIHYIDVDLRLRHETTRYFREGRSHGITCLATTQRPAGVNRWIHSESSWKVFFAPQDQEDAIRMAEIAGSRKHYTDILLKLDREKREFLVIRGLTGESYVSHVTGRITGRPRGNARERVSMR